MKVRYLGKTMVDNPHRRALLVLAHHAVGRRNSTGAVSQSTGQ